MAILHTSWSKKPQKVITPTKKKEDKKRQLPKYKVIVKKPLPEDSEIKE